MRGFGRAVEPGGDVIGGAEDEGASQSLCRVEGCLRPEMTYADVPHRQSSEIVPCLLAFLRLPDWRGSRFRPYRVDRLNYRGPA
jgi:hypothetical protein